MSTEKTLHIGEMTIRVVVADELIQSFDAFMPATGLGPGLHLHTKMDEIFYVYAGKVEITVGDKVIVAGPGDIVRVPKMTPHKWQSLEVPAKMLFSFIPGQDQVKYLTELAELANSGASWRDSIAELQRKYDNKPL